MNLVRQAEEIRDVVRRRNSRLDQERARLAKALVMGRFIAFTYGLICYATFLITTLYAVGFVSGVVVPKTIDSGAIVPTGKAFVVDLLLICVFAIQHSAMARRQFKKKWKRFVPVPIERSTYVLLSSLVLAFLFWQWRPIPAQVWRVADPQIAMPPLKEQSGLPSASAVARKKYGARSMKARSSAVNSVRAKDSRRSEIRRLSN